MNEDAYIRLIRRAAGIIRKYKSLELCEGDLISETFIKYGFVNEDEFAKKMYVYAGLLKTNKYKKIESRLHEDRRCKKCGEIKPSGAFRSWYLRGYLIFDSYCALCKNNIAGVSKRKRRELKMQNPLTRRVVNTILYHNSGTNI